MRKRDDLIATYADDLTHKCGVTTDMDLLTKVTIGLGPSIYNSDSATVAGNDPKERETIKVNFLMKKLGLSEGPGLDSGIETAIDTYGSGERRKYRPVVHYLLVKHFGKEDAYA